MSELNKTSIITPLSQVEPSESFNIVGVLVDFYNCCKIGEKSTFTLDDSTNKIEFNYFVNKEKILSPPFKRCYQIIKIYGVKFEDDNGTLFGYLDDQSHYEIIDDSKILTSRKNLKMLSIVMGINNENLFSPSSPEFQPRSAKRQYIGETGSNQPNQSNQSNQSIISNNLNLPSYTLPNNLTEIQPKQIFQIVAQVVKVIKQNKAPFEFLLTDYTFGHNLSSHNVILPNSEVLNGRYFLKLAVWDTRQRDIIIYAPKYSFFHFSMVGSKMDKNCNQLELFIKGHFSNVITLVPMGHVKIQHIIRKRDEVLGTNE